MASGPAPSSSVRSTVQVAFAVAEPTGEPGDALSFDDTVGDEAHRPRNDVLSHVPLGRSGRGIWSTPLAGPEPVLLRGRCGGEEVDVGPLRRDRRTTRPAVDAGRAHGRHEPSIEALVAALHGDVAVVGIERGHGSILPDGPTFDERKSDVSIDASTRASRRPGRARQSPATGVYEMEWST